MNHIPIHELTPERNDIQGALEHAYELLTPKPPPTASQTPTTDHWAIQGSLVLGPLLWLAKHANDADVLRWLHQTPSRSDIDQTCNTLPETCDLDDINNIRRRLEPYFAQDTDTARTLAQWLPALISQPPIHLV